MTAAVPAVNPVTIPARCDGKMIRKSLALTTIPGEVYELRTVSKFGKPYSGFFNDFEKQS